MQVLDNILFVTSEQTYLHLDHDTVVLRRDGETDKTLPLLAFGSIILFGDVMLSPALMKRCAADGRTITLMDRSGRFRARIEGPVSGNVLLRQAQYGVIADLGRALAISRSFVAGKIQNSRNNVLRTARESKSEEDQDALREVADRLGEALYRIPLAQDLDALRGVEGDAAHQQFRVFGAMVLADRETFGIRGRNRRPPLDPTNALLSFIYTILTHECASALEGVGLDPQAGILHTLRPGRPALALDLMEEFRPVVGDRLVLTLINRRQITAADFIWREGGAVVFKEEARKKVLSAYIEKRKEEVTHPATGKKVPIGLLPHLQARLLARVVRGDLDVYPPYVSRG